MTNLKSDYLNSRFEKGGFAKLMHTKGWEELGLHGKEVQLFRKIEIDDFGNDIWEVIVEDGGLRMIYSSTAEMNPLKK
mgnify:CR=1 FL=1